MAEMKAGKMADLWAHRKAWQRVDLSAMKTVDWMAVLSVRLRAAVTAVMLAWKMVGRSELYWAERMVDMMAS